MYVCSYVFVFCIKFAENGDSSQKSLEIEYVLQLIQIPRHLLFHFGSFLLIYGRGFNKYWSP